MSAAAGLKRMVRNVTLGHPNSLDFELYRRVETPVDDGLADIDRMGELSSEDAIQYHYEYIGSGGALQSNPFEAGILNDAMSVAVDTDAEHQFLLEPAVDGEFTPQKRDVIYVVMTDVIKLAYEIADVSALLNMPGGPQRYGVNRAPDVDIMP